MSESGYHNSCFDHRFRYFQYNQCWVALPLCEGHPSISTESAVLCRGGAEVRQDRIRWLRDTCQLVLYGAMYPTISSKWCVVGNWTHPTVSSKLQPLRNEW